MKVINIKPEKTKLSNYALNTFIAPRLSELTECNANDMSHLKEKWLNNYILNTIVKIGETNEKNAYFINFLRRAEAIFNEYENARIALIKYISSERNNISPYFKALLHFETFFAQLHQAYQLIKTLTGHEAYEPGDNSILDRVRKIHNTSKHMNERIEKSSKIDKKTCAIWITNEGVEFIDIGDNIINITFSELEEVMVELNQLTINFEFK